jgi:DNA polymerase-3 subunit epsilon
MKTILILDTETTGIDPATSTTIEVGVILYSVEHGTSLMSYASLLEAKENPAEAINRIPAAALGGHNASQAWADVETMADRADAIVAHRAEFDRGFVTQHLRDVKPWICSKFDLEWPRGKPGESLVQLALEHDLGVAYAHRALADCDLLARLFTRVREMGVDVAEMLRRALRPKADFVALVSYEDRELAKKAAFQWDGIARQWKRRMFLEDVDKLPFRVRQVAA